MPELENAQAGLSVKEAAEIIGVSYQTVHNWISTGSLPVTRFGPTGRIIRIDRADLELMRRGSERGGPPTNG